MTDQLLRSLERRWRQSGALADEVAYLAELRHAGRLTREMLELAAHCDHPAALQLLGLRPSVEGRPIERWGFEIVGGWGREAGLRALHAVQEPEGLNHDAYWAELLEDGGAGILEQLGHVLHAAALAARSVEHVRRLVTAGLVPWALGERDPCPDPPWSRPLKARRAE